MSDMEMEIERQLNKVGLLTLKYIYITVRELTLKQRTASERVNLIS